jgi:hypothetical protein
MPIIINPYAFATAGVGGGGSSFDATAYTGLNRWYTGKDNTYLTQDSGFVRGMLDKSGNGYDAARYTTSNPSTNPTLSTINGIQAVLFGGLEGYFVSETGMTPFQGSDLPHTLFAVIEIDSLAATATYVSMDRTTSGNGRQHLYVLATPTWATRKIANALTDSGAITGGTPATGTPYLVTWVHTGTAVTVRVNGADVISAATSNVATFSPDRFTIGARKNLTVKAEQFPGKIGEIALYEGALGGTDIDDAEAKLAADWGITI